jgi:hypothetical protein
VSEPVRISQILPTAKGYGNVIDKLGPDPKKRKSPFLPVEDSQKPDIFPGRFHRFLDGG